MPPKSKPAANPTAPRGSNVLSYFNTIFDHRDGVGREKQHPWEKAYANAMLHYISRAAELDKHIFAKSESREIYTHSAVQILELSQDRKSNQDAILDYCAHIENLELRSLGWRHRSNNNLLDLFHVPYEPSSYFPQKGTDRHMFAPKIRRILYCFRVVYEKIVAMRNLEITDNLASGTLTAKYDKYFLSLVLGEDHGDALESGNCILQPLSSPAFSINDFFMKGPITLFLKNDIIIEEIWEMFTIGDIPFKQDDVEDGKHDIFTEPRESTRYKTGLYWLQQRQAHDIQRIMRILHLMPQSTHGERIDAIMAATGDSVKYPLDFYIRAI